MTTPSPMPDNTGNEELTNAEKNAQLLERAQKRVEEINGLLQIPNAPGETLSDLQTEKSNLEFAITEIEKNPDLPPIEPEEN